MQQARAHQGELPVAVIDRIHGPVQPVKAVLFACKQLLLSLDRARVQGGDLHLEHPFAAPVLTEHAFAQRDDRLAVVGRGVRSETMAAEPALPGAKADQVALGHKCVLAHPRPQLLGHVHQVHEDNVVLGGIRGHDLAVSHALGGTNPGFHRGRVLAAAHLPDALARVAEALPEHADREPSDLPAGDSPVPGREPGDAPVDPAQFGNGHVRQPLAGFPGSNDGQAVGFFLGDRGQEYLIAKLAA